MATQPQRLIAVDHARPRTRSRTRPRARSQTRARQELWIIFGQATLICFVLVGFGAYPMPPQQRAALIIFLATLTIIFGPRDSWKRLAMTFTMPLFVTWWLLSSMWTVNAWAWTSITIQTLPVVFAVVVAARVLPTEKIKSAFCVSHYLVLALCAKAILLNPASATSHPDGNPGWRGAFIHKNEMTPWLLIGMATLVCFERRPRLRRVALVLSLFLLVMSHSSTALSALLTLVCGFVWLRTYLSQNRRVGSAMVIASALGSIAVLVSTTIVMPYIVNLYGKDLTFSSRTKIWSAAWPQIEKRPFQGYGIGGVWIDPSRPPTVDINRPLGFTVFHAHNGAIEILLLLGVVGLVLYVLLLLATMRAGWQRLADDPDLGRWVVLTGLIAVVFSITEISVLGPWLALLAVSQVMCITDRAGTRSEVFRSRQLDTRVALAGVPRSS